MRLTENTRRKNYAKNHQLHTTAQLCQAISSQLQHVLTTEKKMLNSNISSTCLRNMVNFSPLTAEIGRWVWGTPENVNEFHVLASLLHQRRLTEINQTLHGVWAATLYIHFWGLLPLTEFCQVQSSLCVESWVTARHSSSGHQPNLAA